MLFWKILTYSFFPTPCWTRRVKSAVGYVGAFVMGLSLETKGEVIIENSEKASQIPSSR